MEVRGCSCGKHLEVSAFEEVSFPSTEQYLPALCQCEIKWLPSATL